MSKRILVVEDQENDRQIIRNMLAGTDYQITEAEDGEHALAAVAKERPDLILMEIQLPSMDGYETNATNPGRSCALSIPIIAVSCYAPSEEQQKAHGRLAATTLCPSLTAYSNYCRKFAITCNSTGLNCR